ncbi:MAG: efflux transporter outer membrane subunit [Sedimentisphaerales bacterium]|jgi:NodT family efflux transporter outer membrane factor (OMF) lipoprotein
MNNGYYKTKTILLLTLCTCLLQSGCMVGPDYKAPEPNAPAKWAGQAGPQGAESPEKILLQWWTEFNDPNLTSLIERAMQSNLDLKLAEERIRQARATLGVVEAPFWPTADVTASYTRNRAGGPVPTTSNLFMTGLDAVWELDIFGGTRRSIEAAKADIQASIEDRRDVLVTLASEVALNYVQLRGFQQEIVIAQNNLQAQRQSAEVVRKRYEGGFVSALDVANADAQVATTLSQIPVLETSAQQAIFNLSVLLGREPAALLEELSPPSSIPVTPPEVPTGLPSEMLRRRPDIRRAEAQIHSATAQIGVATADLFPKFNLAGSVSLQADKPSQLRWSQRAWSFGPSVDWQIFAAGRVWSNIEVQKSLQQQALLDYKKTVLTALQDVENALVAYDKEHQRNSALIDAVSANLKAVELSTELYAEGQTEFLSVLVAQGSLYSSEEALVQSTRNLSTDLVALYKALGGGWDSNPPQTTQPASLMNAMPNGTK